MTGTFAALRDRIPARCPEKNQLQLEEHAFSHHDSSHPSPFGYLTLAIFGHSLSDLYRPVSTYRVAISS